MSKTRKWYARPVYALVALALVLSFSLVSVPAVASTIDLAVNDENPWTDGAFTFENILPGGDPMEFDFKLHNVGDTPGVLTFSMNVSENDMAGAPDPNMSADEFASLIYVEAVSYQFKWPADPEKQPEGYIGAVHDDLDSWLLIDEYLGNNDGKVSLYELCDASPIPYDDEDDPLQATAEITYFIEFQLGNSLEPFEAGGAILTDGEDNSLQGDGISVTITATLGTGTDIEQSSGNVFQAAGPVLNVNTGVTYGTIQLAVDAAGVGHTLQVAAGTYDEQVVINKSLTLEGAGNTTVIQPSGPVLTATTSIPWIGGGTGTMSAIVSVEATGGTVIIEDLMIDGSLITSKSTTWVGGLVYLETSGKVEGVTVNGGSTLPDRTAGIFAAAISEPTSLEVTGCTVEVYTRAGIYALGAEFTADYHHNVINGPGSVEIGVPNGMFFLRGANGSATYNTVTDLGYTGEEYRSTGIGTYNAGTDVTFAHNDVSNVQNAFALAKNTVGTIVEYNTAYDCHTGVRIESGAANSIIQYNSIEGNTYAIRCGAGTVQFGVGNVAHFNNFVDNIGAEAESPNYVGAVSIHPDATNILNALYNWWGDETGPSHDLNLGGQGDTVSDNVDFSPWLYKTQEQFVSGAPCYAGSVVLENEATDVGSGSYAGGWNSFSTPITLDSSANTVSELLALTTGSGLFIERAQRFDLASQAWVPVIMGNVVDEDYQIKPGEGFFIQVSTKGSLPILCNTSPTSPPMTNLVAGWNLIGMSSLGAETVETALSGVSYSVVLSPKPPNDVAWSVPLSGAADKELLLGEAYWVAMGEPGILFGFTTTSVAGDMTWGLNQ